MPFMHVPPVHAEPLAFTGFVHAPVDMSQLPATWHSSDAVQTRGVPVQAPVWQLSPVVHGLPSLQVVPFGAVGLLHAPVAGSQVPATWQASCAVHTTGTPEVQVPFMHDEPQVPPHGVPFALFTWPQLPFAMLH
jgi:hypothetical protein